MRWLRLCLALLLTSQAWAAVPPKLPTTDWVVQQSAQCLDAIAAAERKYGTPPGLLATIGRVESGRPVPPNNAMQPWPWAIDADGAALYLDSKPAAVAWVQQALAHGAKLVDVGCMQVNLQMHPGAFASVADAFDPAQNADYAARFLMQLYREAGGNWDMAVGYYHSHTPDLAAGYRDRVAQMGAGILAGAIGDQSLFRRAVRQGTIRMALAGGGMLVLNLNRQPAAKGHRKPTPCEVARVLGDDMAAPPRQGVCPPARH